MTQRYHHHSSIIYDIIAPTTSIREVQKRNGIQPKDFISQNKQQIRMTEEYLRQQQIEQEEIAQRPPFKMQQFEAATSKISEKLEETKPTQTHYFLRKNQQISQVQVPKPRNDSSASSRSSARKEEQAAEQKRGQPLAAIEHQSYAPKPQRNYIKENAQAAKAAPAKQEVQEKATHRLGEVPDYLKQRQSEEQQLREEKERIEAEKKKLAKIPKGCREVDDEERYALLKDLKEALAFENKRLNSFKFVADNQSALKARQECIDKIGQLEKTIADFERPGPLYLALD